MSFPVVRLSWAVVPEGVARREVAWGLLRGLLPPDAMLSNPCPRCGGPHGPVRVDGAPALASVAYAGGLAIVGVVDAGSAAAVGIDAEPEVDARRDAAGLAGVLAEGRDASVREWVRVEAALKADGRGLRVDPRDVRVSGPADHWTAVVPGGSLLRGRDLEGPPGVVLGVAIVPRDEGQTRTSA